jgi:hypothetical protein
MNIFLALFVKTTWLGNVRCFILTILCHFLIVDSSVPDILIFCSDPYSGVELVADLARSGSESCLDMFVTIGNKFCQIGGKSLNFVNY